MSHGPLGCAAATGDLNWRHVGFEVCVEWGQVLADPYALLPQEVIDDLMAQDWDFNVGPPSGHYVTGCSFVGPPGPANTPSGFFGGGIMLHCVKLDGQKPTFADIGKWVDFTPYAGFPMWLRVCQVSQQCSWINSTANANSAHGSPIFGGHYDFNTFLGL